MVLYIVLLVLVFVLCLIILLVLLINKSQLRRLLYYQYNYIPEPLISLVKVKNLKNYNDLSV
ncbi:PIF-7 [Rachiplusia nu nucleopolyhedrovirus]|uniref:PIF-7 n=1 Tax=Rachiplusia nu nucleopolyhedrovirus TaxID=2605775 RepID=A0AAE6IRC1_9ABAC|nr:PIF-7 [Rachiplusia nu nucleopolyhedrovirus]QEI03619.1 PIF-7 [Rachiplusia nu nucleopolyhedrovirus]